MNNGQSLSLELQEIAEIDLREINGGYGYWSGHDQGSAAFSALVSSAWNEFCSGFGEGYSEARGGR